MKLRRDMHAAHHLISWFARIRVEFAEKMLGVDETVALEWGRISAMRTRGEAEILIAATAVVHNLVLVTRNVSDFHVVGAVVVNPWTT